MSNNTSTPYSIAYTKQLEALLSEALDSLKYVNNACQCKRFNRSREYKGFDYGEEHSKLGKPSVGSRWKTPCDFLKDEKIIALIERQLNHDKTPGAEAFRR